MAKTTIEYEASDIDFAGNKMHAALLGTLLVGALLLSTARKPGDPPPTKEETDKASKTAVAAMLTLIESAGFSLVQKETPPPAFRDIFGSGL